MTTKDIESVQIMATCKDGKHLMAISDDVILINFIASICKFVELREDLFATCSLKELIKK